MAAAITVAAIPVNAITVATGSGTGNRHEDTAGKHQGSDYQQGSQYQQNER